MRPIIEQGSEKSSTPLEPSSSADDPTLLARLSNVSDKRVDAAARQVANYSADDDDNDKRWSKAEQRRTFYKIRRWFFWFLFILVCVVSTVVAGGYLYLVSLWVANLVWGIPLHDVAALKGLIDSVLWTALVVLATLFGESVFKDNER